ncbi:MAG: S9 family peptidase [Acidobacteriota bacterium]|nr:S9 family peptidase [Acidobacteriota bacterium]
MRPPAPAPRPHEITAHGDTRVDPYFWLRERDDEEVLAHLRAENDYRSTSLARLKPLENDIFAEMKSRIEETDISVPVRRNAWWYYERTREGLSYPISCRAPFDGDPTPPVIDPATPVLGEQVILDENVEAEGHDFLSVGVFSVSPDDSWVAVGTDFDGAERHRVTFRPLAGQERVDDVLENLYYGFAWAMDNRHVFYTVVDEAMRPFQIWRHVLGTSQSDDVLILQEDDAQFTVSVGRSRDDEVIVIMIGSSTTTEVHYLDAHDPTSALNLVDARRQGIEYGVEHLRDAAGRRWWLKLTNEGAVDFQLLAREEGGPWRVLLAERRGHRLDSVDAFASFLAISERVDGCAALRLVRLLEGEDPFGDDLLERSYLVEADARPSTVGLGENATYDADQVRVVMTSLVTPILVGDVDVASGAVHVRKQQKVRGGYDASRFVTGRLWVRASDGVLVPVSVVALAGVLTREANGELVAPSPAPMLLYGYGSYEISMDPGFSSLRLSLLERGVIFAIAHVRGGGEMGRSWYEMGKLAQKPTTFSDFVAVARDLVERGYTTPERLAARGGSAGGLLMGAVMNLAPELFRCVVAEVPFVDALSTMLDASLPLTVGEWEEWGDPAASATIYRLMKGYSPYDNVRATNADGTPRRYPDLLATGGLNDPRVGFWEPTKWVLALRDANPENVAFLKTEMGAGHGGPSGRYDAWRDEAEVVAFILDKITTSA